MGHYRALWSIAVKHSFNTNGICSCLYFSPTQATRRLLSNAGLLQKKTPDGMQVVYDRSRLEALKLYAADPLEPLCFEFKVFSKDPLFKAYTEPFGVAQDGIIYLDNRGTTPGEGDIGLSSLECVSTEDLIKCNSNDLKNLLDKRERLLPPLMVLRIFADTDEGSHLGRWLESGPSSYSITFNARQTVWKYYLLGSIAKPGAYIYDPDRQVEFDALGETSLSEKRVALAFRSKQSLPLHDVYDYRFQLKEQGQGGEYVLINRLPFASLGQTGKEIIADQSTVVSEIYINN